MKATRLLFKAEMTQALLREIENPGTGKTMTRRTRGLEHVNKNPDAYQFTGFSRDLGYPASHGHLWAGFRHNGMTDEESPLYFKSPHGGPGDLIWCRETFSYAAKRHLNPNQVFYRATDKDVKQFALSYVERESKWRPSIFMPRWTSRITDYITGVRVERLQDISRGDCMSEGCPFPNLNGEAVGKTDPVGWFSDLWKSINGEESWSSNPYVWVIEFRPILANVDAVIANPEMYGIGNETPMRQ